MMLFKKVWGEGDRIRMKAMDEDFTKRAKFPAPVEAEKELNRIFQNIPYGDYWGEDEENEAKAALLAWRHKAVLKAELKARTDTMRIYNKSFKEDGAKDG